MIISSLQIVGAHVFSVLKAIRAERGWQDEGQRWRSCDYGAVITI